VIIYKEKKDTKLGVTFYRRDPQDGGVPEAAIISRLGATGPAVGKLEVGERIMSVQGIDVQGPLHAARLLRESEGYLRISKLPKRDDFDANHERYGRVEADNARRAMEAALPGQLPQSTPRTDAATPRGPGAVNTPLLTGLRVVSGPAGAAPSNSEPATPMESAKLAIDVAGANMQAMQLSLAQATESKVQEIQSNLGNLSARAGRFFGGIAAAMPTQENKRNRAALKIQKAFRAFAARGQFHEERGAVLMLQAASRRRKAQTVLKSKKDVKHHAALQIQRAGRRMVQRKKANVAACQKVADEAAATAKGTSPGILGKLSRSLSFSKRNKGKDGSTPRSNASDASTSSATTSSEPSPTDANAFTETMPKKRSLSFTRRTKKAVADEMRDVQQNV